MGRINIGVFSLEVYDEKSDRHRKLADLFESDDDFCTYVGEFWSLASTANYAKKKGRYSEIYFSYIDDEIVGMVGLIWINDLPELVIGILPEMRGHHYSSILYREYTQYVLDSYQEFNEIYAHIYPDNVYSQMNAEMAGLIQINEKMYVKRRNS